MKARLISLALSASFLAALWFGEFASWTGMQDGHL
jgi:hypothetical protein